MESKTGKRYIAEWDIPNFTNASIPTTWFDEKGFHPFVGGCGIHRAVKTQIECEEIILDYLQKRIEVGLEDLAKRIVFLTALEEELHQPFGLDKYKLKH